MRLLILGVLLAAALALLVTQRKVAPQPEVEGIAPRRERPQAAAKPLASQAPDGVAQTPAQEPTPPPQAPEMPPAPSFSCQGKTRCSEMVSCPEAEYYLSHCPNVKIDGDGDGIPCEEQHCGH